MKNNVHWQTKSFKSNLPVRNMLKFKMYLFNIRIYIVLGTGV